MASQCTKLVEVDKLTFADNVRTPECMQIPSICESFRRNGFKVNHPLVVVEQTNSEGQTVYLVLVGNRRGLGLIWLRDNEPDEYRRILSGGKVPAVVHKGLTAEEMVDFRIDHSTDEDRVPLDDWSIFLAVRQLVLVCDDTQERIAQKLGLLIKRGKNAGKPNRSMVQTRVNLARLPGFVQAEFEKLCREGKDSTLVRWEHVAKLYKAYFSEYVKHPDSDGPEFTALWTDILTPKVVADDISNATSPADPKELSPAEAIKRSQASSSDGLKHALLAVTHQSERNLAEIDARILEGESAVKILGEIKAYLGEKDYAEIRDAARKHAEETAVVPEGPAVDDRSAEEEESYDHPPVKVA